MSEAVPSLGSYLLRKWRKAEQLSQPQAASMIGVNFVQVSKFERGTIKPGRGNAVKIEQASSGAVPVEAWDMAAPADQPVARALRKAAPKRSAA